MNRKTVFLTAAIVSVLLVSVFLVGRASATTGCFTDTNGHWAEEFICWLKDNSIANGYGDGTFGPENTLKRSEMAKLLRLSAEVPPSTGIITINPGHGEWMPMKSNDPIVYNLNGDYSIFFREATGASYLTIHPTIPTLLYGRSLEFKGVELCYQATVNAYIDQILVNIPYNSNGTVSGGLMVYSDGTNRQDATCRYYALPAPVTVGPLEEINVYLYIQWSDSFSALLLGRTTFVLQPSGQPAVPLAPSSNNVTVLTQGTSQDSSLPIFTP